MKLSHITFLIFIWAVLALALPAFAQDATAEVTLSADLQTYSTVDGLVSFQYPAGWVTDKNQRTDSNLTVKLANNEAALAKELFNKDDVFQPGEVHVEVATIALAELVSSMPAGTLTTDATPSDIVQALAKQGMPDTFTFGDPGPTTINDKPAVRMNLTAAKRGEGQLLLTIYDKTWVAALIVYAAPGEGDKWDIVARDILASIKIKRVAKPIVTLEPITTQAYTSEKGNFTIAYPINLQFEDRSNDLPDSGVGGVFYSDPSLKTRTTHESFHAGDVYIEFALAAPDHYHNMFGLSDSLIVDSSTSPADVLNAIIKQTPAPDISYGIVQEFPIAYGTLAQTDISARGNNEGHIYLIKRDTDGTFIFLTIHTAPNELEKGEAAALSIAASLTINLSVKPIIESTVESLAVTQTATTKNGLGSLSYPDTWLNRQFGEGSIYVANSQAALDKSFGSSFESGQVNILASMSTTEEYIKQAQLPASVDATPLELLQFTIKAVGADVKFGTPEATTVGDKLAARVDFQGDSYEGTAWLIEHKKGAIIALQMLTAPGEAKQWEAVALSVASSIRSTD